MKQVRWVLGRLILIIEFVMTPKGTQRDLQSQSKLNQETASFKIYQFKACPFCVKVRHVVKKHNMKIEFVDAKNDLEIRRELETLGGEIKVPCLRISKIEGQDEWLYESDAIISFLDELAAQNDEVKAAI